MATYYWYCVANQPALLNPDKTDAEREVIQKRVEMLHRSWTGDRDYFPRQPSVNWRNSIPRIS